MLTDAEIGIQKILVHDGLARCDRPSVQAWMNVRLFVTSTKLYSSHQHRISDVGTLLLQKPIVRGLIRWDPTTVWGCKRFAIVPCVCWCSWFQSWPCLSGYCGCAISFQSVHAIGSKLLWGFLVIECLFEEISGLSLYTSTQLQQAVVAKLAERFLGSSSQDNTAQLRASALKREHDEQQTGSTHSRSIGWQDSTALAILMHKQVPQMEYFFCDTQRIARNLRVFGSHQGSLVKIEYLSADRGFDHWMSMVDSCPHPRCAGDVLVYQIDFKQPLAQVLADVLDNEDDLPCLACHRQ